MTATGLARQRPSAGRTVQAVGLSLCAMACFQLGGVTAKGLFPALGANGTTAIRLLLSALILAPLTRPWRQRVPRAALGPLLLYGAAMAGVNGFFYLAIRTIPIGIAVSLDFAGPLTVAVLFSRRAADLGWIGLAAGGLVLLLPIAGGAALDPVGLAFTCGSALSWAVYIVAGQRLGAVLPVAQATALGMAVGAAVALPFGIAEAGTKLLSPAILPLALGVAVLSSAFPNVLEMIAMTRLPARVFGVLMSLEPAFGVLFGWLLLGEALSVRQLSGVVLVVLASAGVTATAARALPAPA